MYRLLYLNVVVITESDGFHSNMDGAAGDFGEEMAKYFRTGDDVAQG